METIKISISNTIFIIVCFFAFIALIVFLYQLMYKNQINNTLHGKKPFSFMEPMNFLLSVILIVILIFVIRINVKTNELGRRMDAFYGQLVSNYNSIQSQYQSILKKYDELIKEKQWITESTYEMKGFTEDKTKVKAQVKFSIKEKIPNSELYLVITSTNEENWLKILIEDKGYLSYIVNIELPLIDKYTIDLLEETESYQHRENITTIDLELQYKSRITINTAEVKDQTLTLSFKLHNYEIPGFKLKDLKLKIYTDAITDEESYVFDLTNQLTITEYSDYQLIHVTYTITIPSNETIRYVDIVATDNFGIILPFKYLTVYKYIDK